MSRVTQSTPLLLFKMLRISCLSLVTLVVALDP